MKINNILIFLFIFFISVVKGQTLVESQFNAAVKLIKELKNTNITNPCSSGYFQCSDPDENDVVYINAMDIEYYGINGNDITIKTDLIAFANVSKISIYGNGIRVSVDFLKNIYKLQSLNELYLDTVVGSIGELLLPDSLISIKITTFGTTVPQSFFTIPTLKISTQIQGYKMVNQISKCIDRSRFDSLPVISLPISSLGGLPKNFFNCYDNISDLRLTILNDKSFSASKFVFPKFLPSIVQSLAIYFFSGNQYHSFTFESTIKDIVNLGLLQIEGKGFEIDSSLDYFEVNTKRIEFYNLGDSLLYGCKSNRCFRNLMNGGSWLSDGSNFNLEYVDLSNFDDVTINNNQYIQQLPSNYDYNITADVSFSLSNFYGDIPQSFCSSRSLKFSQMTSINKTVASCFICQGGSYFYENLLDYGSIVFENFNEGTQPSCPNFQIIPASNEIIISTKGGSYEFDGFDLGYKYYESLDINSAIDIVPIPNKRVSLKFPPGEGLNLVKTFYFHVPQFGDLYQFQVTYSYEKPSVLAYRPIVAGSTGFLSFLGSGFLYEDFNNFKINGHEFSGSPATYNQSLLTDQIRPQDGESFNVAALTKDQTSETVEFIYTSTEIMLIPQDSITLRDVGGTVEIRGQFYQKETSKLMALVGDKNCNVTLVNSTSITIKYPSFNPGVYQLYIIDTEIGLFTTIQNTYVDKYIAPLPPYIPTSSSSVSSSDSSSSSNSGSSSDDLVSLSSVLYLSFNLVLLIIIFNIIILNK